jgi:hypothetical protein
MPSLKENRMETSRHLSLLCVYHLRLIMIDKHSNSTRDELIRLHDEAQSIDSRLNCDKDSINDAELHRNLAKIARRLWEDFPSSRRKNKNETE